MAPLGPVARQIEGLERRGWAALSGPDGASFYEELMAEEGLMLFPGLTLDKAATLRAMAAERPWATFQLDDVRVVEANEAAVITYHATATRAGGIGADAGAYRARMSSVYARIDGRWRLLVHQQSPDPAD